MLNANLRVGRLTVPQWAALVVGAVTLWASTSWAGGVHDPSAHLVLAAAPAALVAIPILALFRGNIERYPQQVIRFTGRRARVYGNRALAWLLVSTMKGLSYARLQAARRRD